MKMEKGKTYLINYGQQLGELYVIEEAEKAVRCRSSRTMNSDGSWYLRTEIEKKVVEELTNR